MNTGCFRQCPIRLNVTVLLLEMELRNQNINPHGLVLSCYNYTLADINIIVNVSLDESHYPLLGLICNIWNLSKVQEYSINMGNMDKIITINPGRGNLYLIGSDKLMNQSFSDKGARNEFFEQHDSHFWSCLIYNITSTPLFLLLFNNCLSVTFEIILIL